MVTEYAVSKYHMQAQLFGWLIQAPAPFTAAQLSTVRQFGNANEVQVLTATYNPSLADFTRAATALGIVIALSVLAMSVGLIRSETAPDLRTLTATGASGATRRAITAATAAALGLLGAILGMAGAVHRRDGLDAQRPDRHGRRRAHDRHRDPADRAAAGRRRRRLAIRRA